MKTRVNSVTAYPSRQAPVMSTPAGGDSSEYSRIFRFGFSRRPWRRRRLFCHAAGRQWSARRRRYAGVSHRRDLCGFLYSIKYETITSPSSFTSVLMQLFMMLIILIAACFEI